MLATVIAALGVTISAIALDAFALPHLFNSLDDLLELIDRRGWLAGTAGDALLIVSCACVAIALIAVTSLFVLRRLHVAAPLWIQTVRRLRAARGTKRQDQSRRGAKPRAGTKAQRVGKTIWASSLFGRPVRKIVSPYYSHE